MSAKSFIKRLGTRVRVIDIKRRLVFTFLLTSIVPLVVVCVIFFHIHTQSMREKISDSSIQVLSLVNSNVVGEILKYQNFCGSISISENVRTALKAENITDIERNRMILDIQDLIKSSILYPANAKNVIILSTDGEIFYNLGYDGIYDSDITEIVENIELNSPQDTFTYLKTYANRSMIVMSRKIFNQYNTKDHLGYILVFIDEKSFSQNILFSQESSNTILMDGDGIVLSSYDQSITLGEPLDDLLSNLTDGERKNGSFETKINGNNTLISYFYNTNINKYLISTTPVSYINSEASANIWKILIVWFLLLFICIAIILTIYFSITIPIKNMIDVCRKVSTGEMDCRIEDTDTDELSYLSGSIDTMLTQINSLMNQSVSDEKQKRQLELQMLQYQINPHFLFNTLNTLRFVAQMNNDTVVADGLSALGQILRNTLVNKHDSISISDEIENLKNYFDIQEIRYMGNFEVVYDLEPTLLSCQVPKFILQPLAENSIMHGQRNNGMALKITVRCYKSGQNVILELEDDGIGFNVNENTGQSPGLGGIGVKNVEDRIRLNYGSPYGLYIESSLEAGTLCKITLPKILSDNQAGDSH